ncbi:zinc carboxypeptidase domain-containing protein [Phthorimaea operculella]|nr:zinc carboxypeptidase domain-containing protein [Phthorimaea operculella]
MLKCIFLVFCYSAYVFAKHDLYDGHSLFEITVEDHGQEKIVHDIETDLNLDIWSETMPERPGMVLVPKDVRELFQERLDEAGVLYKVNMENIKEALDYEDEAFAKAASSRANASFPLDAPHRYQVIMDYMDDVAERFPDLVTLGIAARSVEGREIKYMKISTTNFEDTSKPVVMIQSLLHCREWVGLAVTLNAIQKLVVEGAENELLDSIDWIIVPIVNPDGYEFTHTNNRFWRKNRRTGLMIGDICMGVDLNRNFDVLWGTASSSIVCSDTYHGTAPFSEPETQAIRDLIEEHRSRMALFLDIHSFGSMILYGYGSGVLSPNALFLHVNGVNMAQTIDQIKWDWKPNYVVGNIVGVLNYQGSGSASDYGDIVGIPYSYTYELPAFNNMQGVALGFLVDPEFYEQAGYETWEGIKVGAIYATNTFRKSMKSP